MHKNPRKVLSEGHTQANSQIHKNIQKRKLFRRISGKVWIIGFWGIPGRVCEVGVPVTVLHYPVINYATFGPSLLFFVKKGLKRPKKGRSLGGGGSIYMYIYMYIYIYMCVCVCVCVCAYHFICL